MKNIKKIFAIGTGVMLLGLSAMPVAAQTESIIDSQTPLVSHHGGGHHRGGHKQYSHNGSCSYHEGDCYYGDGYNHGDYGEYCYGHGCYRY